MRRAAPLPNWVRASACSLVSDIPGGLLCLTWCYVGLELGGCRRETHVGARDDTCAHVRTRVRAGARSSVTASITKGPSRGMPGSCSPSPRQPDDPTEGP